MTDLIKPMAEFSVEGPLKSISFDIGSYNVVISESIVVQWIVMLVLGIVFFILGRNLKVRSTSRRQMAAEYLVNFFNNMVRDTMGEKYRKYEGGKSRGRDHKEHRSIEKGIPGHREGADGRRIQRGQYCSRHLPSMRETAKNQRKEYLLQRLPGRMQIYNLAGDQWQEIDR